MLLYSLLIRYRICIEIFCSVIISIEILLQEFNDYLKPQSYQKKKKSKHSSALILFVYTLNNNKYFSMTFIKKRKNIIK